MFIAAAEGLKILILKFFGTERHRNADAVHAHVAWLSPLWRCFAPLKDHSAKALASTSPDLPIS